MTRFEELYNTLIEDGFTVEEAEEIRDLVEIEGYSEDEAIYEVISNN